MMMCGASSAHPLFPREVRLTASPAGIALLLFGLRAAHLSETIPPMPREMACSELPKCTRSITLKGALRTGGHHERLDPHYWPEQTGSNPKASGRIRFHRASKAGGAAREGRQRL